MAFFLCLLKHDGGCGLFLYSFCTCPLPPAAHTLENPYRAATLNNPQNKTKSLGSILQNLSFATLWLADTSMSILFISKHVPNRTEYVVWNLIHLSNLPPLLQFPSLTTFKSCSTLLLLLLSYSFGSQILSFMPNILSSPSV